MEERKRRSIQELAALVLAGETPNEGEAVRLLRSPHCPAQAVEVLADSSWVRGSRAVLVQLLRHPACPRPFAWDVLPHLGWADLLSVAREPRGAPPIRRQAERKLVERLPHMAAGERVALARRAPRRVTAAMLREGEERCVQALLDNPCFTEDDAVRLVASNGHAPCVVAVLRHVRWGRQPAVVSAALRAPAVPLGVALGLAATLPVRELERILAVGEVSEILRDKVRVLLHRRGEGECG